MAFACRPAVIVLDEPTTGLDVSTQAHVLATVRDLCRAHGVAALYVTHDLAVVANLADRVAVMYAGRIVEQGPTRRRSSPIPPIRTPGTSSPPRPTSPATGRSSGCAAGRRRPASARSGARSPPRCELAIDACRAAFPADRPRSAAGHSVRCVRAVRGAGSAREHAAAAIAADRRPADAALIVATCRASYTGTRSCTTSTCTSTAASASPSSASPGSGKTTLSRSIGGLHREWTGEILPRRRAARRSRRATARRRSGWRSSTSSRTRTARCNPRRTVGDSVARPLVIGGASTAEPRARSARCSSACR